jgi:arabinofuranan 3-O-arabinosyltransferase
MNNDRPQIGRLALTIAAGLGIGYAIAFAILCATRIIMFDKFGHPGHFDYAEFWSAGKLALSGKVLAAYDTRLIHAAEVATVGHPFKTLIGWFYPPTFFFVAVVMASMPPLLGYLLWTNGTLLLYSATVAAIVRRWEAGFVALAPPWAMLGTLFGQDGLLTAALIGFVLVTLEEQPVLSGLLLALLTYKPQFGLLFPVALAFGGYWRAFFSACAGTVLLVLASGAVFGFAAWPVFFHALGGATQTHLVTNTIGIWPGILSLYGYARWLHLPYEVAAGLQLILSVLCAAVVALAWCSKLSFDLKAACLVTGVALATPYIWVYDLPLLSIALAYLYRNRRFDAIDWTGIALACAAVATFPFNVFSAFPGGNVPAGLVSGGVLAAMLFRRVWQPQMQQEPERASDWPEKAAVGSV